jgi:hypothetical protein
MYGLGDPVYELLRAHKGSTLLLLHPDSSHLCTHCQFLCATLLAYIQCRLELGLCF